jgi:uncharacterized Zn finger protein
MVIDFCEFTIDLSTECPNCSENVEFTLTNAFEDVIGCSECGETFEVKVHG